MSAVSSVFRGLICNPTRLETRPRGVEFLCDHCVGVRSDGTIAFVEPASQLELLSQQFSFPLSAVVTLKAHQFLTPGLIDTHIHAPQYCYAGTATDRPLMEWLSSFAFPTEMRFSDAWFARRVYPMLMQRLLRHGTTTALFYGTIHLDASKILAESAMAAGLRAFVGKVCMDQNSPAGYCEETDASLRDTEAFIRFCRDMALHPPFNHAQVDGCPLIEPVITPRFLPTCSEALCRGLAALADKYNVLIQTHAVESLDEIDSVRSSWRLSGPRTHDSCPIHGSNGLRIVAMRGHSFCIVLA